MKTSDSIEVELLPTQADIITVNANTTYCLWPRAGGKTSGGIGPRIQRLSEVMPRSQILIVSDTYERLENRVIPNIINFLSENLGLIEDIDFVKYKKSPDHWTKPFIPLDKFGRVISFSTGIALCLVSLSVEGSANAFNAQAAIIDEAKFCKEEKINTEVIPALRGQEKRFGHLPEYLSKWFFTDKYGANIKWLLRKKKLVDKEAVEIVVTLQNEIYRLENEMDKYTSNTTLIAYKQKIFSYKQKIDRIRKHLIYVSEMPAYENKQIVGDFYFKSQKRTCTKYEYDVAILNKDPDKVEHTFYPTFSKNNLYRSNKDYDPMAPFFGAMDYNFRISPLPVAQVGGSPSFLYKTVRIVNYFYELYPNGIEDTVKAFCKYYETHGKKVFHYIFDHTAIGRNPMKTTFKDEVIATFKACGWQVYEHYIGEAPEHESKFEKIKAWLLNNGEFAVRVNEDKCDQLISSIGQTPAMIVSGVTKKDKRTEKDPNFPAEDSTHGPDAFDQLLIAFFEWDLLNAQGDDFAIPIRVG